MTDHFELLDGVDAPRALPADLRARLEQQLLASDSPRPLSVEQRADLVAVLPRRRPWWPAAAAAGLAASVAVALVLTSSGSPAPRPAAGPALTGGSAAPSGGSLGAGQTTGGTAGGGAGVGSETGQAPTVVTGPVPAAPRGATAPVPAPGGVARGQRSFPSPHLAAVSPRSGPLTGGTRVRLTGEGLQTTSTVLFGDREGTELVVEADGSVTVLTPAVGSTRSVTVTVVLSDGSRTSRSAGFSYRTG